MNAWFLGVLLALCLSSAAVSLWAAAQLSGRLLALAEFRGRLTALETETDKILAMQKRLAQRQNLGEYRDREAETPTRGNGKVPDWKTDPSGFIAFQERRLRGK